MFAALISAAAAAVLTLLWCAYRYALFLPARKGLPVLLYHQVSEGQNDALTISRGRLERHFAYLVSAGYRAISFAELKESLAGGPPLPPKPVLLTFDDGYLNAFILVYPLLVKYNLKATFFVPTAYIGGFDAWNAASGAAGRIMSYPTVRSMAGPLVEIGLHSHRHENYGAYSAEQIETDVDACVAALEQNETLFTRVFAYPYGGVPRSPQVNSAMRDTFRRHEIDFALRIGSAINLLPPRDVFEMKRTAIRGDDSFREFKIKLRKGRSKLF